MVEIYRHNLFELVRMGAIKFHTWKELAMQAKEADEIAQLLEAE